MTAALHLQQLVLVDFRSYPQLTVGFPPGRVALIGPNGVGKTNVLEAIAWLATMESFRGSPTNAVVRENAAMARVRGELHSDRRVTTIDAELPLRGAGRISVNGKRLARSRDVLGHVRVTVFSPDDLQLIKGGPTERRGFTEMHSFDRPVVGSMRPRTIHSPCGTTSWLRRPMRSGRCVATRSRSWHRWWSRRIARSPRPRPRSRWTTTHHGCQRGWLLPSRQPNSTMCGAPPRPSDRTATI
ncbi:MAG: hypothetical protein E6G39_07960 [Actinobacteria bacterium]|nr:MAG: hypothetical protein E6G39_07960 [Actinomycetota bacterium]